MNLKGELVSIARGARESSRVMTTLSAQEKDSVLKGMARGLLREKKAILAANKKDLRAAARHGVSGPLLERLELTEKKIEDMAQGMLELTRLSDPVGRVLKTWRRPNRLSISKVSVPIGVIAIIYESRPNVTADCIGLCFKSGNSLILRGGSEASNSNKTIFTLLRKVVKKFGIPETSVNLISTRERKAVDILLRLSDYVDLVIPRGGEGLIKKVASTSRIPVIKHYKGICHVYVDDSADLNMAQRLCFNAKVQRPGVCNAMETLLVHKEVAVRFLPGMIKQFLEAGVQIRGCPLSRRISRGRIKKASDKDYYTEYLDLKLSLKVVNGLSEAIEHINKYGSGHSDAIVSDDRESQDEFLRRIDSACVYVNASTRFTDGHQFGMGAEIGISTDKIHARGPMGLEELTTYKYQVVGNGQIRE